MRYAESLEARSLMSVSLSAPNNAPVGTAGDGTVIRVWADPANANRLITQTITREGVTRTGEVNRGVGTPQDQISLDVAPDGTWAVGWVHFTPKVKSTPAMYHARTALFDSPTDATARIVDAGSVAEGTVQNVAVAVNDGGALGVVYGHQNAFTKSGNIVRSVKFQALTPAGSKAGPLATLSDNYVASGAFSVDMNSSGHAVAGWLYPDGEPHLSSDVQVRWLGPTGVPQGPAVRPHDSSVSTQVAVEVEISDVGSSVVLWRDRQPEGGYATAMRHYGAGGVVGDEISFGLTAWYGNRADMAADGTFAVAYLTAADATNADGSTTTTRTQFVRSYAADGTTFSEQQIGETHTGVFANDSWSWSGPFEGIQQVTWVGGNEYFFVRVYDPTPSNGASGDETMLGDYVTVVVPTVV